MKILCIRPYDNLEGAQKFCLNFVGKFLRHFMVGLHTPGKI